MTESFLPGFETGDTRPAGSVPRTSRLKQMAAGPLRISVGVSVCNGEENITQTLASVLQQTVFQPAELSGCKTELIVIAAGCTDRTVEVAEAFLESARQTFAGNNDVSLRLEVVAECGFANAWNQLAARFSRHDADFIFYVNSGIVLESEDGFEQMLLELCKDRRIQMALPAGRRRFDASRCRSLPDRVALAFSRLPGGTASVGICGHCFCLRAAVMRSIRLPSRLPGAFEECARRLILNSLAESLDNPERIGLVGRAVYTYERYRTFQETFSRNVQLLIGRSFVETLVQHLRTLRADQPETDLTAYLKMRDESDPSWLYRLVQLDIHRNGLPAALPSPWYRLRLRKQPNAGFLYGLRRLPDSLFAALFDVPVWCCAAWRLGTGRIAPKHDFNDEL